MISSQDTPALQASTRDLAFSFPLQAFIRPAFSADFLFAVIGFSARPRPAATATVFRAIAQSRFDTAVSFSFHEFSQPSSGSHGASRRTFTPASFALQQEIADCAAGSRMQLRLQPQDLYASALVCDAFIFFAACYFQFLSRL
jgi:hypothetical protein